MDANTDICLKKKSGKKLTGHLLAEALSLYIRTARKEPLSDNSSLINWGCTTITNIGKYIAILNNPAAVNLAVNKKRCIKALDDAVVESVQDLGSIEGARDHIDLGGWVVCRVLTRASAGRGIVLAKTKEELVDAPLYTAYYKKNKEYRYHVFNGAIINIQQKRRLTTEELEERGFEERPPSYIRNLENGYIFAREGVVLYDEVAIQCIEAVNAVGLDFGAVDVLVNTDSSDSFVGSVVCEINTAPGLTGTTLDRYVDAIKEWLDG